MVDYAELLRVAMRSLARNKMRSLLTMLGLGAIFGFYPSHIVTHLDPIKALRFE